ncbi:MAG: rhomboid family intramembrane serine protease [Spirochaetales bacterium]|nr:rhomboid family intramembrane serine protease [Spirochaetales bacterium]
MSRGFLLLGGHSVHEGSFLSLLPRLFLHSMAHFDYAHLSGNLIIILLVGPLIEEKVGSWKLTIIMLITALASGLIHYTLYPNAILGGASDIVFMLIILSSFTQVKDGYIPITFVIITFIFVGKEVAMLVSRSTEGISHSAHIAGAIVGSVCGFGLFSKKKKTKPIE